MFPFLGKLILTVCLVAQGYLLLQDPATIQAFKDGLVSVKDTHSGAYDLIQNYSEYHDSSRYSVAAMFLSSVLFLVFRMRLALFLALWAQMIQTMVFYHNFQHHAISMTAIAKSVSVIGGMWVMISQLNSQIKEQKRKNKNKL